MKLLEERFYIGILILIFLTSCSFNKQYVRESPDFAEKLKKINNFTVVPVEISIFETTADESTSKKDKPNTRSQPLFNHIFVFV